MNEPFSIDEGFGQPVAAAAIHAGHELRPEVASLIALDEATRLREEDPFTDRWTRVVDTRLVGNRSRFEMDLNRPRDKAIYVNPADAWGLNVWRETPSPDVMARSLAQYDAFYASAAHALDGLQQRWGRFVVLDLHSYNHRRDGAGAPAADAAVNPEVNIGTGSMDRDRWAPVVDRALAALRDADFCGRRLDVRENVKFRGGEFSAWVHRRYPQSGCSLALEFRKFFMDEWTGVGDDSEIDATGRLLADLVPLLIEALGRSR